MTYRIVIPDGAVLYAEGKTEHCFVGENMKPLRIKNKYPEIYEVFRKYTDCEVKFQ